MSRKTVGNAIPTVSKTVTVLVPACVNGYCASVPQPAVRLMPQQRYDDETNTTVWVYAPACQLHVDGWWDGDSPDNYPVVTKGFALQEVLYG